MTTATATKPRKSPFRASTAVKRVQPLSSRVTTDAEKRTAMLADYELHLRTTTNRRGRPYQVRTINAYRFAVVALDHWMAEGEVSGDFTACDTATLNRFFRWYYEKHDVPKSPDGQGGFTGGTNTEQRNLRPFFTWLSEEFDHPDPWTDRGLQRYAAPEPGRKKTLSHEFIDDLLQVTGGGSPKVKDFARLRDHAIIRVLTEGLRAEELGNLRVQDIDFESGLLEVIPLKGLRNSRERRIVPLQPKTLLAIRRYLRARALHSRADEEWLWLGMRGRGRLQYKGFYWMLKRRAEEAGYDPVNTPHMYKHTTIHELLEAQVSGEDIAYVAGWKSTAMLRHYGADMAHDRAVKSVQRLGDRH
ncbi:tyrosine-type recombinase/integrase [Streptomyces roseifaciens]